MKKTRKILSLLLAVVMLCSVCSGALSAFAATSGPYSYELINDGQEVKITAYNENQAKVSIPEKIDGKRVTVIGAYAFSMVSHMESVKIPKYVKTIEHHAFYMSGRLESVTVPANVDTIGAYAFASCGRIEKITIKNGVKSIGDYAFAECNRLLKVVIPGSVTRIGDYAFFGCGRIETVSMKKGVQDIGHYAFAACTGLKRFTSRRRSRTSATALSRVTFA